MADPVRSPSFLGGVNFENDRQRAMWVAPFTALVLWMTMLLVLYGMDNRKRTTASASMGNTAIPTSEEPYAKTHTLADRVARAVRAARLLFFMMFTSTVISALGFGATSATVILIWVAFAIGCLWVLAEMATDSHWLRLLSSICIFPLVIAVWGLAFRRRVVVAGVSQ